MSSTVLENLTVEELAVIVRGIVDERLGEIIGDPDFGLEIRGEVQTALLKQMAEVEAGDFGRPFVTVIKELGLDENVSTPD